MQASKDPLRFSSAALRRAKTFATHARSVAWAARGGRDPHGGLRILFYHRIADERDPLAVRVDRFREQIELLAGQGFRVLDVAAAWRTVTQPDGVAGADRVIGLSFDDGYRDVAENALPVLEELGFGATVFIVTGAVDGAVKFGWYERTPPLLNWAEIEHLDATSPLRFEAHSETHANLLSLSLDAARRELLQSKATLESHLGRPVVGFCYPAGLFGSRERQLAAECGFELAVGSDPGSNDIHTDPLVLRRTQVEPGDRIYDFRAKVGGGHDRPLPFRASYRRRRFGVPDVAEQRIDHDGAAAADRRAGTGESPAGP
jgi:peptidoglycan/xylan/chitin deacetylase (PgdA/CDA1 family)